MSFGSAAPAVGEAGLIFLSSCVCAPSPCSNACHGSHCPHFGRVDQEVTSGPLTSGSKDGLPWTDGRPQIQDSGSRGFLKADITCPCCAHMCTPRQRVSRTHRAHARACRCGLTQVHTRDAQTRMRLPPEWVHEALNAQTCAHVHMCTQSSKTSSKLPDEQPPPWARTQRGQLKPSGLGAHHGREQPEP